MTFAAEVVTLGAHHFDIDAARTQVINSIMPVEQADERPDCATGIVVLGFAKQQGAAALEVAQVDVITERGPDNLAGTVDRQHHFRLRIVPGRIGPNADFGANPDGGHGLRLVEHFGVGTDTHLEIGRPQVAPDQRVLQANCFH